MMKAIVFPRYGDHRVLQLLERPTPAPGPGEIQVKVKSSSVNKADWYYVAGRPYPIRMLAGGALRPRRNIPGIDFAGVTALQGLLVHGGLRNGMRVLVSGASGGVGMFAVQLAKAFGANVTALCRAEKFEAVNQFGADHTYSGELEDLASQGEIFDIVLDAAAYRPFGDYRAVLGPKGRYVLAGGNLTELMKVGISNAVTLDRGGRRFLNFLCRPRAEDLDVLAQLTCEGMIRPFVGKTVHLSQAPSGLETMVQRQMRGKVAIQIDSKQ